MVIANIYPLTTISPPIHSIHTVLVSPRFAACGLWLVSMS